jgi:glucosyl-dolichyl phosphate glucuronosyltransferase
MISVAICTWNNAATLAMTLESLRGLVCPSALEYEILVIDNNSTDHTGAVIQKFATTFASTFRSVVEPRQGLSYARNRAIAEARGDIICFIDDDAVVDDGLLEAHAAAYRADESVVAVGGRIQLRWPENFARPSWLAPQLDSYLSGLDLGPECKEIEYPLYPYGCNMSVRRCIAQEIGGFCVRLGRKKYSLISNEERHFFFRIYERKGRVMYVPTAIVHHVIPVERLSKEFFVRRGYAQGVSDVAFLRETASPSMTRGQRSRVFLAALKSLAEVHVRTLTEVLHTCNGSTCFLGLVRSAYAVGRIMGAVRSVR